MMILGAEIVEQAIKEKSGIGVSMLNLLLNGEALSTEFIVHLLK